MCSTNQKKIIIIIKRTKIEKWTKYDEFVLAEFNDPDSKARPSFYFSTSSFRLKNIYVILKVIAEHSIGMWHEWNKKKKKITIKKTYNEKKNWNAHGQTILVQWTLITNKTSKAFNFFSFAFSMVSFHDITYFGHYTEFSQYRQTPKNVPND